MKHFARLLVMIFVTLMIGDALAVPSVEECRARADRAERETRGALAGATGGAVGGAALGGLVGRSTGAKRGAAIGAVAGGLKNANNKKDAYNREFESCMRAREEALAREQAEQN